MSSKLGELIKATLTKQGMSQSELARRLHRNRSYVHYLVGDKNALARKGAMAPPPDAIRQLAKALGIPANEALTAAGLPPEEGGDTVAPQIRAIRPPSPGSQAARVPGDQGIYEIAVAAALDAIKRSSAASASSRSDVVIDLADGVTLTLAGLPDGLSGEQKERYKVALRAAFESVE